MHWPRDYPSLAVLITAPFNLADAEQFPRFKKINTRNHSERFVIR